MSYYLSKTLSITFEEALARVTKALKNEGFGILTEIDVKQTLKQKIDVDFREYRILGACNPNYAHQALVQEPNLGLLLPCNVVVQKCDSGIDISIINPVSAMQVTNNPKLASFASEVKALLEKVLASV